MGSSNNVKSALRTLDILEFLAQRPTPVAAHEIAAALAIPISSLSYLLTTLVERGYLDRTGRLYGLGPAVARLQAGGAGLTLKDRVAPLVRDLRNELNETAGFFVMRGFEIEALASEIGLQPLRYTLEVGQRAPMHAFSAGKALLAVLDENQLNQYFATVFRAKLTPRTIIDEAALRRQIEEIRQTGIARSEEEHTPGTLGLGKAVVVDGLPLGAFSIGVPLPRFDQAVERRAIEILNRLADNLAASSARAAQG